MSRMGVLGVVLIVLGVAALVVRSFTYLDRREVLDIGPIEATAEVEERVVVPTWAGIALLASGFLLVAGSSKKT